MGKVKKEKACFFLDRDTVKLLATAKQLSRVNKSVLVDRAVSTYLGNKSVHEVARLGDDK
ncbi:hypothetical protein [Priestia megaterium]|uniref:hypothetical protein n=1 Tax=Priestia megaterium TaxID=1404 RepID=UPI0018669302|nr:hypothetical protein [Priestia megaterium]MBE2978949.1 hypothetical protein [Priestia megaterium]